jgi:hypothetical protein
MRRPRPVLDARGERPDDGNAIERGHLRPVPSGIELERQISELRARHAAEEQELIAAAARKAADERAVKTAESPAEQYVTVAELTKRIPYKEQTIRNLMLQGVLRRGVHYFKPHGRIIFKLSAVMAWIEGQR